MSVGSDSKPRFQESWCGHIVGLLLLCYGFANTLLFIKFTPVYVATQCGDQVATLERFSLGKTIKVGLKIQVTCWNPNAYQVQIMTSQPGHVYVGEDRGFSVGELTLVQGSTLPQKGTGDIQVQMLAELSPETSERLLPHFLSDKEIPMFLDLQFEVGVSLNFGLMSFGTAAPFKKKCGMNLAGLLVNTASRLGPMECRESYADLAGILPHVGEATGGEMSFSGAQMDPDRIAMGEMAKNISIIGVGGMCYVFGIYLTYCWIRKACKVEAPPPPDRQQEARLMQAFAGQPSCMRATSGNMEMSRTVVKPADGVVSRASNYLLGRTATGPKPMGVGEASAMLGGTGRPLDRSAGVNPVLNFLSCGALAKRERQAAAAAAAAGATRPSMLYQPSCARAISGNMAEEAGYRGGFW